jgi:hypothetical protein
MPILTGFVRENYHNNKQQLSFILDDYTRGKLLEVPVGSYVNIKQGKDGWLMDWNENKNWKPKQPQPTNDIPY